MGSALVGLVAGLAVRAASQSAPSSTTPPVETADASLRPVQVMSSSEEARLTPLEEPGAAMTSFGLDLFARLSSKHDNVFISPWSIFSAVGMVSLGVTPGDDALASKFTSTLRYDVPAGLEPLRRLSAGLAIGDDEGDASSGVTLLNANSVWIRDGALKPDYVSALAVNFDAAAKDMPSDAAPVNAWVSERTQGLIKDLVDDATVANPLTRALVINAVYFKGAWRRAFDASLTRAGTFRAPGGDMDCQLMAMSAKLAYAELADGTLAVALPYGNETGGGGVRAAVMLPPEGSRSLAAVAPDPVRWAEVSRALSSPGAARAVNLKLPRFKMEFGVEDLTAELKDMGLEPAFTGSEGFLGMSTDPDLHLGAVLHKAQVEVNEEGTVAAAATAAVMVTRSMPAPPVEMTVDRPFFFFVEDEASGALLFSGAVSKV